MNKVDFLLQPDLGRDLLNDSETESKELALEIQELEKVAFLLMDEIKRKQAAIDDLYQKLQSQETKQGSLVEERLIEDQKELDALKTHLASIKSLTEYIPFLFYLKILHNDPTPAAQRSTAKGLWATIILSKKGNLDILLAEMKRVISDKKSFVQKAMNTLDEIRGRIGATENEVSLDTLTSLEEAQGKYLQNLYQTMFEFGVPLAVAHAQVAVSDDVLSFIIQELQSWGQTQVLNINQDIQGQFMNHPIFRLTPTESNYDQLRRLLFKIEPELASKLPLSPETQDIDRMTLRT